MEPVYVRWSKTDILLKVRQSVLYIYLPTVFMHVCSEVSENNDFFKYDYIFYSLIYRQVSACVFNEVFENAFCRWRETESFWSLIYYLCIFY